MESGDDLGFSEFPGSSGNLKDKKSEIKRGNLKPVINSDYKGPKDKERETKPVNARFPQGFFHFKIKDHIEYPEIKDNKTAAALAEKMLSQISQWYYLAGLEVVDEDFLVFAEEELRFYTHQASLLSPVALGFGYKNGIYTEVITAIQLFIHTYKKDQLASLLSEKKNKGQEIVPPSNLRVKKNSERANPSLILSTDNNKQEDTSPSPFDYSNSEAAQYLQQEVFPKVSDNNTIAFEKGRANKAGFNENISRYFLSPSLHSLNSFERHSFLRKTTTSTTSKNSFESLDYSLFEVEDYFETGRIPATLIESCYKFMAPIDLEEEPIEEAKKLTDDQKKRQKKLIALKKEMLLPLGDLYYLLGLGVLDDEEEKDSFWVFFEKQRSIYQAKAEETNPPGIKAFYTEILEEILEFEALVLDSNGQKRSTYIDKLGFNKLVKTDLSFVEVITAEFAECFDEGLKQKKENFDIRKQVASLMARRKREKFLPSLTLTPENRKALAFKRTFLMPPVENDFRAMPSPDDLVNHPVLRKEIIELIHTLKKESREQLKQDSAAYKEKVGKIAVLEKLLEKKCKMGSKIIEENLAGSNIAYQEKSKDELQKERLKEELDDFFQKDWTRFKEVKDFIQEKFTPYKPSVFSESRAQKLLDKIETHYKNACNFKAHRETYYVVRDAFTKKTLATFMHPADVEEFIRNQEKPIEDKLSNLRPRTATYDVLKLNAFVEKVSDAKAGESTVFWGQSTVEKMWVSCCYIPEVKEFYQDKILQGNDIPEFSRDEIKAFERIIFDEQGFVALSEKARQVRQAELDEFLINDEMLRKKMEVKLKKLKFELRQLQNKTGVIGKSNLGEVRKKYYSSITDRKMVKQRILEELLFEKLPNSVGSSFYERTQCIFETMSALLSQKYYKSFSDGFFSETRDLLEEIRQFYSKKTEETTREKTWYCVTEKVLLENNSGGSEGEGSTDLKLGQVSGGGDEDGSRVSLLPSSDEEGGLEEKESLLPTKQQPQPRKPAVTDHTSKKMEFYPTLQEAHDSIKNDKDAQGEGKEFIVRKVKAVFSTDSIDSKGCEELQWFAFDKKFLSSIYCEKQGEKYQVFKKDEAPDSLEAKETYFNENEEENVKKELFKLLPRAPRPGKTVPFTVESSSHDLLKDELKENKKTAIPLSDLLKESIDRHINELEHKKEESMRLSALRDVLTSKQNALRKLRDFRVSSSYFPEETFEAFQAFYNRMAFESPEVFSGIFSSETKKLFEEAKSELRTPLTGYTEETYYGVYYFNANTRDHNLESCFKKPDGGNWMQALDLHLKAKKLDEAEYYVVPIHVLSKKAPDGSKVIRQLFLENFKRVEKKYVKASLLENVPRYFLDSKFSSDMGLTADPAVVQEIKDSLYSLEKEKDKKGENKFEFSISKKPGNKFLLIRDENLKQQIENRIANLEKEIDQFDSDCLKQREVEFLNTLLCAQISKDDNLERRRKLLKMKAKFSIQCPQIKLDAEFFPTETQKILEEIDDFYKRPLEKLLEKPLLIVNPVIRKKLAKAENLSEAFKNDFLNAQIKPGSFKGDLSEMRIKKFNEIKEKHKDNFPAQFEKDFKTSLSFIPENLVNPVSQLYEDAIKLIETLRIEILKTEDAKQKRLKHEKIALLKKLLACQYLRGQESEAKAFLKETKKFYSDALGFSSRTRALFRQIEGSIASRMNWDATASHKQNDESDEKIRFYPFFKKKAKEKVKKNAQAGEVKLGNQV